jgi:hypothetical protein
MSPSPMPAQSLSDITPESAVCDSCSVELEKEMPSTLTSSPNPKDVRAYEHDRQRVKKAAERVLTKAKKERGWTMRRGAAYAKCSCCQSDKAKRLGAKDVKGLLDGDVVSDVAFLESRRLRSDSGPTLSSQPFKGFASATRDVKLADLVTAGRPKKSKGNLVFTSFRPFFHSRKPAERDFEFIPHIRSVIVLDDVFGDDIDEEEAWEHVLLEDELDEKIQCPSYAQVVAIVK